MLQQYMTGLQHIGIPTKNTDVTVAFYEGLGFKTYWRLQNDQHDVAFLENNQMVIETYVADTLDRTGAIDHIAINVNDIQAVFNTVKAAGYKLIDPEIITLPSFFDNGCSYFMIEGPNKERVEFNQIL